MKGLKLLTAVTAFTVSAAGSASAECQSDYTLSIRNGEVVGDFVQIDNKSQQSVYEGANALDNVKINNTSFGEWTGEIADKMVQMEKDYGLSMMVMGGNDGHVLISDNLGAPAKVDTLAGYYAKEASDIMLKGGENALDDFIKMSSIAKDIKELGQAVDGMNNVLSHSDTTISIKGDVKPSYTVGRPAKCEL